MLPHDGLRDGTTIISQGGFHGRTYGAMALTTSKTVYRQGFAPLMPQVCWSCHSRDEPGAGNP